MAVKFPPPREADLLAWSLNADLLFKDDAAAFGLSVEQQAAFTALVTAFQVLYNECNQPATRTTIKVEDKNVAKKDLIAEARKLIAIVQAYPGTTNAMRQDLQVTVRDYEPTPVPVPEEMPVLRVKEVRGYLFDLSLLNQENQKQKPEGARAAWLYTWVGETPSPDLKQWQFMGETTRSDPQVTLPESVGAGTMVWCTALWVNPTGKPGPACAPVKDFTNHLGMNQAA